MNDPNKQNNNYDYTHDQLPNYYKENGAIGVTTTSNGNPIYEDNAVLTVGRHGPLVLEDRQYLENISHFARERIPERVVHAKGSSAAGEFTCTVDLTHLTSATIFSQPGKRTPMRIRFSTVAGSMGSADTVRDPRGFAMKFYTEDGNWDLVGNNTPIFFIRDPILFPAFIHSQKPNPVTNVHDWNAIWDFFSLRHESIHQVLILMSDRGIPDGHRHMHGFGSHTFSLVNSAGTKTFCKFHFKTQQGIKNLTSEQAAQIASTDPDYSQRDLYNAIASGNFPRWKAYIQTMTPQQSEAVDFDPFDVTKIWPQGDYPLQEIGEFVLNKNPDNYFAEVEQLAFCPGNFIPGIGPSQDRMLLGRIFSYKDTHLYRLGANFNQLPINAPLESAKNFQRAGKNTFFSQGGAPNYHPNSFGGPHSNTKLRKSYPTLRITGSLGRYDTGDDDNYRQPQVFYKQTLKADERQRIADNIVEGLKFTIKIIQDRTIAMFKNVDEDLARKISNGLKAANVSVTL